MARIVLTLDLDSCQTTPEERGRMARELDFWAQTAPEQFFWYREGRALDFETTVQVLEDDQ